MGRALLAVLLLASMPSAQDELVISVSGSKEYHRPHCDIVRKGGDHLLALTVGQASGRGLKPHAACDPAKNPPPGTPKPVHVYVDGGRYYHRDDKCSKLGSKPKRVLLDTAAQKYWPCSTCKPPIRPRKPRTGS